MNLIISGWPAAGTSTLSLMIANLLGYQYLSGGDFMKHFAEEIAGETSGPIYVEFEKKYGKWWDHIWEPYAIWKVSNSEKLLLEAKTAGFFVEDKENLFEIMLIANQFSRETRAKRDKREDASNTIEDRDIHLQRRWLGQYNIDLFDIQLIQDHYDLVIDNSGLTIEDEINMVFTYLEEDYRFPSVNLGGARKKIEELLAIHEKGGKLALKEELLKKKLIISTKEVANDWVQYFDELLEKLPVQMLDVIDELKTV